MPNGVTTRGLASGLAKPKGMTSPGDDCGLSASHSSSLSLSLSNEPVLDVRGSEGVDSTLAVRERLR